MDQVQADGTFGTSHYQATETIWREGLDGHQSRMLDLGRQVTWRLSAGGFQGQEELRRFAGPHHPRDGGRTAARRVPSE